MIKVTVSGTSAVSPSGPVTDPLTDEELLHELAAVEQAIARTVGFCRSVDASGQVRVRINQELLDRVEQEHQLATELRRRNRLSSSGSARPTSRSGTPDD